MKNNLCSGLSQTVHTSKLAKTVYIRELLRRAYWTVNKMWKSFQRVTVVWESTTTAQEYAQLSARARGCEKRAGEECRQHFAPTSAARRSFVVQSPADRDRLGVSNSNRSLRGISHRCSQHGVNSHDLQSHNRHNHHGVSNHSHRWTSSHNLRGANRRNRRHLTRRRESASKVSFVWKIKRPPSDVFSPRHAFQNAKSTRNWLRKKYLWTRYRWAGQSIPLQSRTVMRQRHWLSAARKQRPASFPTWQVC